MALNVPGSERMRGLVNVRGLQIRALVRLHAHLDCWIPSRVQPRRRFNGGYHDMDGFHLE